MFGWSESVGQERNAASAISHNSCCERMGSDQHAHVSLRCPIPNAHTL